MSCPRDIQAFLDGYPHTNNDRRLSANLHFYSNELRCRPDALLISEIHDRWLGDYKTLERRHGFIQWLFPIREDGMNEWSQILQQHEIHAMKADSRIMERVLVSYQMMLDFYGMRLVSPETGMLCRAPPPRNYAARYGNLVRFRHNNLRITRILKCLSELGLERLNAGLLLHVLNEQSEFNELRSSCIVDSMDSYWANCIRNEDERQWIARLIEKVREGDGYIFTRADYEAALQRRHTTGRLRGEDPMVNGG